MTTFKQCAKCAQIVEWAPPRVEKYTHAHVYPVTCVGGNEPRLCPYWGSWATAEGERVPDGTTGVVIDEAGEFPPGHPIWDILSPSPEPDRPS